MERTEMYALIKINPAVSGGVIITGKFDSTLICLVCA